MNTNVDIKHYKKGKLVDVVSVHNIWTTYGSQYLAEVITYLTLDPDTTARDERILYLQVGMGSTQGGVSDDAQVAATYPAGNDPNATTGNEYQVIDPTSPVITTLELPVKRTGATTAYPGGGSDEWLWGPTQGLFFTHQDNISVSVHVPIDTSGGDITGVWAPTEQLSLSEAGLCLSSAGANTAYNNVVAYVSFPRIPLDDDTQLEFIWTVRFLHAA